MRTIGILAGASALALGAVPAAADGLRDAVAADLPELTALYRDLHANPELAFRRSKPPKSSPPAPVHWASR
jgi:hypothetical protein